MSLRDMANQTLNGAVEAMRRRSQEDLGRTEVQRGAGDLEGSGSPLSELCATQHHAACWGCGCKCHQPESGSEGEGAAGMLREFHETFAHPDTDALWLRPTLHEEEHRELTEALLAAQETPCQDSHEQVARELADVVYIAYGTALLYGIDLDVALREVHRANMTKVGENGQPIRREDGKVLKGPNFSPPDMSAAISPAPTPTEEPQPAAVIDADEWEQAKRDPRLREFAERADRWLAATEGPEVERVKLTPAEAERLLAEKDREIARLEGKLETEFIAYESLRRSRSRRAARLCLRASKLEGLLSSAADALRILLDCAQAETNGDIRKRDEAWLEAVDAASTLYPRLHDRLQAQHSPEEGKKTGDRCEGCDREQLVGDEGWESRDMLDWCPDCFEEDPCACAPEGPHAADCLARGCRASGQPTDTPSQPDGISVVDQLVVAVLRARAGLPEGTRVDLSTPEAAMLRCDLEAIAAYLPAPGLSDQDRERLEGIATNIEWQFQGRAVPESAERDAVAFLRNLADKTPEPEEGEYVRVSDLPAIQEQARQEEREKSLQRLRSFSTELQRTIEAELGPLDPDTPEGG